MRTITDILRLQVEVVLFTIAPPMATIRVINEVCEHLDSQCPCITLHCHRLAYDQQAVQMCIRSSKPWLGKQAPMHRLCRLSPLIILLVRDKVSTAAKTLHRCMALVIQAHTRQTTPHP